MTDIQKKSEGGSGEDVKIYNNPAATLPHEQGKRFYAVALEGYGSYGSTPEEARESLEVVGREYASVNQEGRAAMRELAAERVKEIADVGDTPMTDGDAR
jgi:hypothetical protein